MPNEEAATYRRRMPEPSVTQWHGVESAEASPHEFHNRPKARPALLTCRDEGVALGGWRKRALDIVLASVAIIGLLPLTLLLAAAIRLSDGGPVLFRHERIGRNGRPFGCLKFRTMAQNGDEILRRHLAEEPDAAREWERSRKLRNDPRLTRLGYGLRKSSVDELPQLINILKGEMSFVGPRPITIAEIPKYGENIEQYLKARPGLTGSWQVSGRNDTDYGQRVQIDCDYIENWCTWNDLKILGRTLFVVISTRGCY
jgi:exopolysaccharide production protein ExoY